MSPTRDPRDRPKTRPVRTRKPLCHAASAEAAKVYKEAHREFLNAYRIASAAYRSGCYDVAFPSGTFRSLLAAVPHIRYAILQYC